MQIVKPSDVNLKICDIGGTKSIEPILMSIGVGCSCSASPAAANIVKNKLQFLLNKHLLKKCEFVLRQVIADKNSLQECSCKLMDFWEDKKPLRCTNDHTAGVSLIFPFFFIRCSTENRNWQQPN